MTTRHEPLGTAAAFGLLVLGPGIGALALDSSPAWAALETRTYEIPPGPVATALRRFAEKSGTILVYDSALTRDRRTPGLEGPATVHEGLGKLLSGTGLSYSLAPGKKSIAIMLAQNDTLRSDAGAEALPPIDVGAESPRGGSGGSGGSANDPKAYVVPNASTATKTDTPIMETPASVKVVPQAVLRDQQIIRVEKAVQNVSGVVQVPSNQGGSDAFSIRGFGTDTIYRDGVVIPSFLGGGTTKRDTANLERVEVLKGPASILYGRTEPGGIVNLVTKQPLDTPYYSVQQQIGSYAFYRTTVDATGPLTQDRSVLYRVNLAYENAESFRDFVKNDRISIAPVIKWNIDNNTHVTFEFEYQKYHDVPDPGIPPYGAIGLGAIVPELAIFNQTLKYGRPSPVPRSLFVAEPAFNKTQGERYLFGFNASHKFDENWTFRQSFLGEVWRFNGRNTMSFGESQADGTLTRRYNSAFPGATSDRYYLTSNLIGNVETFGIKHTLLFGFDYFHFDDNVVGNCCTRARGFNIFAPGYLDAGFVPTDRNLNYRTSLTQAWHAWYFQDQVELPYNIFLLSGFRYDVASAMDNVNAIVTSKENHVSPRAGVLWRPIPWLSVYGSYTENFGISNSLYRSPTQNPAPNQTAQQWEGGVKAELLDGKLMATASYFDLTKQNIAVSDPLDPNIVRTIGEAESRGLEFDLSAELLAGWRVIAAYTHLGYAKVNKDVGFDGGPGSTGKRFFLAPRNFGSLWTTYEFQNSGLSGVKIGGGIVAQDSRFGNQDNTYVLPSYAVFNIMGSYTFDMQGMKMTAQLNIDNLFDRTYFVGTNCCNFITPGAPRSFLGSLRVEF